MKNQELISDRPGRSFSSAGPRRHGHSPPIDPNEQVAIDFSKEVARFLDEARKKNDYDSLILIAGPQFLGRLRQDMSQATCKCVLKSLDKNLGGMNESEIKNYLQEVALNEANARSEPFGEMS